MCGAEDGLTNTSLTARRSRILSQLKKLIEVLKRGYIWTLNIGETYNISNETWDLFSKELINTNVTHMYASEHTITGECKKLIMATMRENRKHTTRHVDPENLSVIKGITHCWWNPINAKCLLPYLQAEVSTLRARLCVL